MSVDADAPLDPSGRPAGRADPARPPATNPRARRRRILYLVGLLPLLAALAFAAKVMVMGQHDRAGLAAFDDADAATALEDFDANRSLNVFEPWIAHFDTGNAAFALTDYPRAIDLYLQALDTVPGREECTVRINLALGHEKVGDAASTSGDLEGARDAWEDGITVLTDGRCPTDAGRGQQQSRDAATVKERLDGKLNPPPPPPPQPDQNQNPNQNPDQNRPREREQNPDRGQNQQPSPQQREQQQKRDRLQQRNQEGEQNQRDYRELDEYGEEGYQYQW